MPNGDSKQLAATGLLSQIPFGSIVGAPLKAAVEAQADAARACFDFISQVGFVQDDVKDATGTVTKVDRRVRDITFVFERTAPAPAPGTGGDTGTAVGPTSRVAITVPLLTIMPLPFIRIESMTVNFKASISAMDTMTKTDTSSTSGDLKGDATLGFGWWKVNLGGSISSKKDSTATNTSKYSVEHTMDINVHAVQDDMPAGLAKMLSIMTDAIAVMPRG